MITIEARLTKRKFNTLGQELIDLISTVDRLDDAFINLIVITDSEVDALTNFLDLHNIEYRLV